MILACDLYYQKYIYNYVRHPFHAFICFSKICEFEYLVHVVNIYRGKDIEGWMKRKHFLSYWSAMQLESNFKFEVWYLAQLFNEMSVSRDLSEIRYNLYRKLIPAMGWLPGNLTKMKLCNGQLIKPHNVRTMKRYAQK